MEKCKVCQSIDLPPMHWLKGKLDVSNTWYQVRMNIAHYQGSHYLSPVDCGSTQFSAWCHLRWQCVANIIGHLEAQECSLSTEMLADSDTAFCSKPFRVFMNEWGVRQWLCCEHVLSGNGITEWCHLSVKSIALRKLFHNGSSLLAQHHPKG